MNTPTLDFLLNHARKQAVSFHMPGHKGSAIYKRFGFESFLENFMDCDVTEIPGADNLFQTEGILKASQDAYARLYGAKKSYLLINGSSCGIMASILATVPRGGKLIMARNSHKSIFNALTIGGIRPVYAYPELLPEQGISGAISPAEIKALLEAHPDASAVMLPSPNYYGICSDIEAIAREVHAAGKVLIVDQAHGAHLKFFNAAMPMAAEDAGADLVINSIHKTLASFTQSALLNLCSDRVDIALLEDKLQTLESTSPSYVLMSSLDINRALVENQGEILFREWADNLDYFYKEAAKIGGLKVMDSVSGLDKTKINLDMSARGFSGSELETTLIDEYGIYSELTTGNILMCMTGIGNTREDYTKLLTALREIAEAGSGDSSYSKLGNTGLNSKATSEAGSQFEATFGAEFDAEPKTSTPLTFHRFELRDIPEERIRLPLKDAAGRVCAGSLIPYPPGIPLICPGEVLTVEVIDHLLTLRSQGEKVIGIDEAGEVFVGKK